MKIATSLLIWLLDWLPMLHFQEVTHNWPKLLTNCQILSISVSHLTISLLLSWILILVFFLFPETITSWEKPDEGGFHEGIWWEWRWENWIEWGKAISFVAFLYFKLLILVVLYSISGELHSIDISLQTLQLCIYI